MSSDSKPINLLITRLSAHGDVIQTLPLLGLIKKHRPDVRVGWVVEASGAPLLEGHPLIDTLHVSYRKQWLARLKRNPFAIVSVLTEAWQFIQTIRSQGYTHSVDVQGLLKSAIIPFIAGIPKRYGYKATREGADRFYTHCIPPHIMTDTQTPTVLWFSAFASHALGVDLSAYRTNPSTLPYPLSPPDDSDLEAVKSRLASGFRHYNAPVMVVAPFTLWPSKQWAVPHWQSVLAYLATLTVRVVVVGSPADATSFPELSQGLPADVVQNWMGTTSWPQLQALMTQAIYFMGQDSAPLHIAQAVAHQNPNKTPYITALFGPTAPLRTGPIGDQHRVLSTQLDCQPCFKRRCPLKTDACMTALTPELVISHLKQRFGEILPEATRYE